MVCDDAHYNSFVLTMYNVGSIIGTPIYGALSDKIGRKITFFITIVITTVSSIASVLMQDFTAFVVIKTINGSLMPCVFQLPYIIILEIVAPEMRTRMNGIVNLAWTVGVCILPVLAYYSKTWVTLGLLTSSVTVVFLFYYTFLPESPRWLLSVERYEEAADILCKIGEKNNQVAEKSDLIQKLEKLGEKMKKEKTLDNVQNSSMDLLRYPQLRKKFIIITFCWMANITAYYGLQLNISNLAGNEFINFFLLSVVEIPGYLTSWYIMERFGRRWCSVCGFLLCGLVCMLAAVEFPYNDIISSMLGKYCAAGTFMATYQQSSELYPTVVRSLGMGMSSTVAMLVTLVVPYIVYLGIYGKSIPFVIIGLSGIVAGIMAAFLPETLNENLPQTISDAEQFGLNQKFFSWNRRRHSVGRERASFAIKVKPMETIDEDSECKIQRASQILQNVEFVPGNEDTGAVTKDMQKKDYTNSEKQQNIDDKNDKSAGTQITGGSEIDKDECLNKATIHSGDKNSDEKFSYVNMVFDNNDVKYAGTGNDSISKVDV
ncbi:organic cation transporter 1 [Trichonephila clavipes]|nr:organic cation transporter 1 [Trichonephila clavipes]